MNKLFASFLIVMVLSIVGFGTWQLFLGNWEAAFSAFPFLLVLYFFVNLNKK